MVWSAADPSVRPVTTAAGPQRGLSRVFVEPAGPGALSAPRVSPCTARGAIEHGFEADLEFVVGLRDS
eukprot:11207708-Lingulodinium_polyedra.AAC.1